MPKSNGGQAGHKGDTLEMVEQPDEIKQLRPQRCACGKRLLRQDMEVNARRQIFDIPPPKLEVVEYQQMSCCCPDCGAVNVGEFPSGVSAPVQYGHGVQAVVNLLSVKCQLSHQNIGELFGDLYGQSINDGTIQSFLSKGNDRCESVEQSIKDHLFSSASIHGDETGLNIGGKRHWLHVLSNDKWTYLFAHAKRGREAINEYAAALKDYTGYLIHDCLSTYWGYVLAVHCLCVPHLLRELTAQVEQKRSWAEQMYLLLLQLYDKYQQGKTIHRRSHEWRLYQQICRQAFEEEPSPSRNDKGKIKKTKGRNLAERLLKRQAEVLRFVMEDGVPFSNNQAERDLRPAKGKQKVAGCFRTQTGAQRYARMQGVISTLRKQGHHVFEALKVILSGREFSF
ncbi:MAG: IS66 family transposase [Chlamydiota bacterium]